MELIEKRGSVFAQQDIKKRGKATLEKQTVFVRRITEF